MRNLFFGFLVLSAAAGTMGCSGAPAPQANAPQPIEFADVIYFGGPILPIEPMVEVEAMATRGDKILRVGDLASVLQLRSENTQMFDLAGRTLMPGFVEPHLHINVTANQLTSVWVGSYVDAKQTKQQILDKLKAAVADPKLGPWLYATGFDPSRLDPPLTLDATLDVNDLNGVSTEIPIFVLNDSGHIAYVNQAAFDAAGITDSTPDPTGGTYVKENGKLTGQLNEPPAYKAFFDVMPPPTIGELVGSFFEVQRAFSEAGITTAGDMNTGLSYGLKNEIEILRGLAPLSPLRLRSYPAYLALNGEAPPVSPGEGDDKLKFIGIKFTTDGSTQGFTGALSEPYLQVPGHQGGGTGTLDYPSTPELISLVRPFFDQGWQISCHSNGDRAIDQALDVYAALLATHAQPFSRRLRIEHFTVTNESQIDRARDLGVTPSMTIGHTFYWGKAFNDLILGEDRAQRIDAAASIAARNIPFSFHSDCPVSPAFPLRYLENSVGRVPQLMPPATLGSAQKITVDQALRAITINGAYQVFMDDKVGSLAPGKYADFVILGSNPRTTATPDLAEIPILHVYLGGKRQGPNVGPKQPFAERYGR